MDDLRTRAQLVAFDSAGAIGTVVTRAEVAEAAAGTEFPATLLLDLDRIETAEGDEVTAHATLAVDWDREELERLLSSTDDEEIGLWFEESELAQAFDDADVEGHGFRQRAATIAVAAAAAGASATPALASQVAGDQGGGGGAPAAAVVAQPAGAERGLLQDEQMAVTQTHGTAGAGFDVNPQASGQGAVVQPPGAERALLQDEQAAVAKETGTAVTSSGGTSTLSTGELAGAVAGGALLIAAAGFGAARRRTPPAQPA